MTAKAIINGQSIALHATTKREATPDGRSIWVDDQGYTYCIVGEEDTYHIPIVIDEPHATRLRIGKELAAHRTARGISQAQLASMVGVKEQTIQALEQGRYTTSLDKVNHIVAHIGCHLTIAPND